MALFIAIGNLSFPSPFLHDFLGPKYGFFKAIMTVKMGKVFDHVRILDVPPPVSISDTRNIPGSVANGTGYELAEFYGRGHR